MGVAARSCAGLSLLSVSLAFPGSTSPNRVLKPAAVLTADPWPGKNGDLNRSGSSPYGVPYNLTSGPTWRWISDFPNDIVRAAPLVDAAGGIYIATVSSGRVIKFSAEGKELWRYSSNGKPYDSTFDREANSEHQIPEVPALMNGALYVVTAGGMAISLDTLTGGVNWIVNMSDNAPGDTFSMTAGLGTVLVATIGDVSGGGESRLTALEGTSGKKLWQYDIPTTDGKAAYNIMVALVEDAVWGGPVAVFSSAIGDVYKLCLASGTVIWSVLGPQPAGFSTGGAIIGPDSTVYVTSNLGTTATAVPGAATTGVVAAYDLTSGELKWMNKLGALKDANNGAAIGRLEGPSSPLRVVIAVGPNPGPSLRHLFDGEIAGFNQTDGEPKPASTIALDAATGKVVWEYEMPLWHDAAMGDTPEHICLPDSSANVAIGGDGVVYVPHEDGRLYAMRDADANGVISAEEVNWWDFGMTFQGSPALAPHMLVVSPCDGLAAWVA